MTELEKRIYNCWLATTRSKTNKPFKLRKKWDGFEDKIEYNYVKKVASILKRYDNINIDDWFNAPYDLYPEQHVAYDLQFYSTMKAFACYRINKQKTEKLTHDEFYKTIKKTSC